MPLSNPIVLKADTALNDSDKTFTVPAGNLWRLQILQAKLTTTATVGNRQLRLRIGDGSNILWTRNFGATQAASLQRGYYAAWDLPDDVAFDGDGNIRLQMAQWILPTGFTVQLYDSAAIDAAADDLEYRLLVEEITP